MAEGVPALEPCGKIINVDLDRERKVPATPERLRWMIKNANSLASTLSLLLPGMTNTLYTIPTLTRVPPLTTVPERGKTHILCVGLSVISLSA
jgi:hypothetical protein